MKNDLISPQQHYKNLTDKGLVTFDSSQQQALMALQTLHQQLSSAPSQSYSSDHTISSRSISGLYLWGKVGRGKTFLMDSFVESFASGVCLRQHFHHFMQDIHAQLTELSGSKEPLKKIARRLKEHHDVLCFDEFFVNDIGDAMLLGRLIMFLFEQNMIVVATSNCEPSELYKDGLQRRNFLPAIKAIQQNMLIIELAGKKDHRERKLHKMQNYFVISHEKKCGSLNKERISNLLDHYHFDIKFSELTHKSNFNASGVLRILNRDINYLAVKHKTIIFEFSELCLGPRSHFDYIEIAKQFDTVFLIDVPALGGGIFEQIKARGTEDGCIGSGNTGERQVMLAQMDDGARRFIALIDELYDQQVILFLTCQVPLNELYTQGSLAFQFERARSRLIEMGSIEYMDNTQT